MVGMLVGRLSLLVCWLVGSRCWYMYVGWWAVMVGTCMLVGRLSWLVCWLVGKYMPKARALLHSKKV